MKRFGAKKLLVMLMVVCMLLTAMPAFAANNSVTVYFTLSSDGEPMKGNDSAGTVLARHKVTVPYFDLGLYGLQQYYRYETNGDFGDYINSTIVRKPTVFHLYIYMLERYYQGLPESECCKGNLELDLVKKARTRSGAVASQGKKALYTTGAAKSMYMANFWGHDENLMYFVDHQYPLMGAGWGSTADYILLKDGMDIDVAMFSNWGFYHYGSFMYFENDSYNFSAGEQQTLRVLGGGTSEPVQGGFTNVSSSKGMNVYLWDRDMKTKIATIGQTDKYGCVDYTFTEPGTYLISAEDPNLGTENAAHAPATAVVRVVDKSVALEGINFEKVLYNLEYGNTVQLMPIVTPSNATDVTMTWTSSDPDIVSVNDVGVVSGKGSGTATVTCKATDGKNTYAASCEVYVGEVVDVEGVELLKDNVTVAVGEQVALEYNILPAEATTPYVQWRTSECFDFNKTYTAEDYITAKVDHQGIVTGIKPGTVTVYVKTNDGGFTDICTVTVVEAATPSVPDVSGDGDVNGRDAVLILQYVANLADLKDAQLALADMDGNGSVNGRDAVLLLQYIAAK